MALGGEEVVLCQLFLRAVLEVVALEVGEWRQGTATPKTDLQAIFSPDGCGVVSRRQLPRPSTNTHHRRDPASGRPGHINLTTRQYCPSVHCCADERAREHPSATAPQHDTSGLAAPGHRLRRSGVAVAKERLSQQQQAREEQTETFLGGRGTLGCVMGGGKIRVGTQQNF